MDALLTTLIDIVRVSALIGENQNTLRVAQARDILLDICPQQFPQHVLNQLAEEMVACVAGRSTTLPNLDVIEPALSQPECAAQLARATSALNDMLLLYHALHAKSEQPIKLTVTNPHFFDYLQQLQLGAAPGHPRVMLIGPLLPSQGNVDLRFDANIQLLRRVAISYSAASPFPHLDLTLWSASPSIPAQGERQSWRQKDGLEHDLNVWARNDPNNKGAIRTRRISLPYTLNTTRVSMHIDAFAGLELLETSVLDSHGAMIANCLRMARIAAR